MDGLIVPCEMQLANGAGVQERSLGGQSSNLSRQVAGELRIQETGFYQDWDKKTEKQQNKYLNEVITPEYYKDKWEGDEKANKLFKIMERDFAEKTSFSFGLAPEPRITVNFSVKRRGICRDEIQVVYIGERSESAARQSKYL